MRCLTSCRVVYIFLQLFITLNQLHLNDTHRQLYMHTSFMYIIHTTYLHTCKSPCTPQDVVSLSSRPTSLTPATLPTHQALFSLIPLMCVHPSTYLPTSSPPYVLHYPLNLYVYAHIRTPAFSLAISQSSLLTCMYISHVHVTCTCV